jgi:hypothetical protein
MFTSFTILHLNNKAPIMLKQCSVKGSNSIAAGSERTPK